MTGLHESRIAHRELTAIEAAEAFGVHRRTMYRWIDAAGLTPSRRVPSRGRGGTQSYYLLADVAALVAAWRSDTPRL